jgi:hypothetical protein
VLQAGWSNSGQGYKCVVMCEKKRKRGIRRKIRKEVEKKVE